MLLFSGFFWGESLDYSDSGFHILRFYLLFHICMDAIISIFPMLCLRQILFGVFFLPFPFYFKICLQNKKKNPSRIRQVLFRLKTNIIQIIAAIRNMKENFVFRMSFDYCLIKGKLIVHTKLTFIYLEQQTATRNELFQFKKKLI